MPDVKRQILRYLMEQKAPVRAHTISCEVEKAQSHIDYHLKTLIEEGRVVVTENGNGASFYSAQRLLSNQKVRRNFLEVFLNAMPKMLDYMDLSKCEDPTEAFINNVRDLLQATDEDLKKELKSLKKF